MPKSKNKKAAFIDKKNAVSFSLIHRSQQDPLAADSDAPQMVLQPISLLQKEKEKVKEEEREHGVFYEDEYNYLQHLVDRTKVDHDWSEADRFVLQAGERKEEKSLNLPSTVFGTKGEEEKVGLLNKAAPVGLDLSLDPDIVAALDEDFDFDDPDNALDDEFVVNAMEVREGGQSDGEWEDDSDVDSDCGGGRSEEDDEVPSLQSWTGEETGTKFTNYSMSSSCIKRNNQLSLLDDKFDRFMDQYGEMEEGALEGEEIEGTMEEGCDRMKQLVEESAKERALTRQQLMREREVQKRMLMEGNSDDDSDMEEIVVKEKLDRWDCESVLSTYSTLYNHPKIITERRTDQIRLSTKTGIPKDTLGRGLTAGALKQLDRDTGVLEEDMVSVRSKMSEFSIRPKHETPEEKKTRKVGLKQVRKERREEKKANTMAFKSEQLRQEKININIRNNVQGITIC
eukprot:GFUD01007314.1.p1 GENE.GFUD01007314.1~~GFUD01007314.1.p1  ORF type:complete len:455 (-),score=189.53 GFUD01007314.1:149-1513(-)